MSRILDWLDDRTGYRGLLHALLWLNFPVSRTSSWRYVWGGTLMLMFLVEVVTGTLLMTVYSPSEAAAWGSVQYLETQTQWGGFVRGLHHTTSHLMLVVMVCHLLMVLITAAYTRPREVTYWTGLLLGLLTVGLAITGNPLPWDQKGYQAYQIETSIVGTMPVIGGLLRTLLVGGAEFGNLTLTRLYTLHVVVLPTLATLLLMVHFALVRREKLRSHATVEASEAESRAQPYWPYQSTRNLAAFFFLILVAGLLAWQFPAWETRGMATEEWDLPVSALRLTAPADPDLPHLARPEWYVRPLYELRHMVPADQEVLITGLLPMVILALLVLVPFYDRALGRVAGWGLGAALGLALVLGSGWLLWKGWSEDHADPAFARAKEGEMGLAARSLYLAHENGIPPEGPRALLQGDSKTRGPRLFAEHCAGCHTWNGHDGLGKRAVEVVDGEQRPVKGTAPDLAGFGTTDWVLRFLQGPDGPNFFGQTDQIEGGERLKEGDMAQWTRENVKPGGLQESHLRGVAALLAREAGLARAESLAEEDLKVGAGVFAGDAMDAQGEPLDYAQCLQCHELKAGDPDGAGSGGISPGLDLNGYGSAGWLADFLRNPGAKRFYGKKNVMPAFDAERLPERDLKILVQWMRGEWQGKKGGEAPPAAP